MAECDPAEGFASVYDIVYGAPAGADDPFLAAQLSFVQARCPAPPAAILDAGCGTGRHVLPLAQRGYRLVGMDLSRPMLGQARAKGSHIPARLVHGDLLALPFGDGSFDIALCLESPLAYLHADEELRRALANLRRVLRPAAHLIVDVFDYPGTLGTAPIPPHKGTFIAQWGTVEIAESHRYDRRGAVWHMNQEFTVQRGRSRERFVMEHRLRIRSADEYASSLEAAGFEIEELLIAYPNMPPELAGERRLIFVCRAPARSSRSIPDS